jgi:hypothetical protein
VACASGGALAIHIMGRVSLLGALAILLLGGGVLASVVLRSLPPYARTLLRQRAFAGLKAGLVAIVAYDITRYGIVAVLDLSFRPFHVFEIFGQLLLGENAPAAMALAAGTAYHFINGIGFGVAYLVFVRRPRVWNGIAWAMVLEVSMILLYPSWLRLEQVGELATVSVLGHVAYGTALALVGRRLVESSTRVPPPPPMGLMT